MKPYQTVCKTITFDNCAEFMDILSTALTLGYNVYCVKPHRSWERGLNENTKGLLRYFLLKEMKIDKLPKSLNDHAVFRVNAMPDEKKVKLLEPIGIFNMQGYVAMLVIYW
ncbi:hypothetical protein [Microbulbifer sp. A4B17]|uniref:hypothetical protein n=1 Tax=Microbulbifer sp. A4B17 TaxID=359370 RepID=UPI0013006D32|nr:hypothetical protein [Microbulbifer sp. A4B17]